jgi:hypothetical protein
VNACTSDALEAGIGKDKDKSQDLRSTIEEIVVRRRINKAKNKTR